MAGVYEAGVIFFISVASVSFLLNHQRFVFCSFFLFCILRGAKKKKCCNWVGRSHFF